MVLALHAQTKNTKPLKMKVLFLIYHGFSEVSGISKKIRYQVKGLEQNGHKVHLCYYDRGSNGHWQRFVECKNRTVVIDDYGTGKMAGLRQRTSYNAIYKYCIEQKIQIVYARCFMNASPFLNKFFGKLKKRDIKAVMEIPTYPYDQEFNGFPFMTRMNLHIDQLFRKGLARQLEAIVTFTNEQQIFGQQTINISNGVDLDSIPLHKKVDSSKELHLIGVAEVHYWHGYDRLIAGLGEYYKKNFNGSTSQKPVFFHIVGGVWKSEMYNSIHAPGFAELIEKYGLQDKVIFHDQLFGEKLNAVFEISSFAVGSLARHRSGISDIKTLKNREYASRGLPFIYSENDSDFDDKPYVVKAVADESPIDIQHIVEFEEQLKLSPQEIRQTVEHLSWKVQMQKVIESI